MRRGSASSQFDSEISGGRYGDVVAGDDITTRLTICRNEPGELIADGYPVAVTIGAADGRDR